MHIKKVFLDPDKSIDRKTYLKWTLPFNIFLAIIFTAMTFSFSEMLIIKIIEVSFLVFGPHYDQFVLDLLIALSIAIVVYLSTKRFRDINKPWYLALFMLPVPILWPIFSIWLYVEKSADEEYYT